MRDESPPESFKFSNIVLFYDGGYLECWRNVVVQGEKNQDLPLLMATEFHMEWAETKHRYVFTHHVHHKFSKDYIGLCVESLR